MIMTREITNDDAFIDSRDVIARIEELNEMAADDESELTDDEARELVALTALADEGQYVGDWIYGATLIRESYFETYAREFAEDIHGTALRDATWPFTSIDWEDAANDLRMDYTEIEFQGVTYLVRS